MFGLSKKKKKTSYQKLKVHASVLKQSKMKINLNSLNMLSP